MQRSLLLLLIFAFLASHLHAQKNGILPLTGIKYFREGVWGKSIEVTINGNTLTGNQIPMNADFDLKLTYPTGFVADAKGAYHPGIKVLLLNARKDTIAFSPNMFSESKGIGFTSANFKSLTATLGYYEKLKPGDTIYQYFTFFDTKSKNKLTLDFPVTITDSLQTREMLYTASSTSGYNAAACGGIQLKKIEAYLDSIYYPKSLYHSLRSAEMLGITTEEVNKGKYEVWLFDENMKEIPLFNEAKQYAAKTFTGREEINILVQIPLNPIDTKNKKYTARYRWESGDGKKVLDIVNKFW
ncbi:MAG: hypothetical protein IPP48_03600 [Chitinophagaceae bacterium]|nr:hypothetical protein [Chitinophagaceae bacterium]